MIGRQRLRRAELVNGVHVITDAKWPRGGVNFEQGKAALFAQMRHEFYMRSTQPVVPFVHLTMEA